MKKYFVFCFLVIVCLGIDAQQSKSDWAQFYFYDEDNKHIEITPKAIFIGNSITEDWGREMPDFFEENNFLCRGIGGQVTSQMLVRFRKDVIQHHPKYVVIMAGTNDIAQNNGYIALENIVGNLLSMCELARCNGIVPVLCTVLPATHYPWRKEIDAKSEIAKLNNMIKAVAEDYNIILVDYYSKLVTGDKGLPKEFEKDSVHPNRKGFEFLRNIITSYLK